MAKSKLHPLAKQGGFKTNADFYKKYPTPEAYNMAMGGAFKGRKGPFPQIQNDQEFFSREYANIKSPYNGSSLEYGGMPEYQMAGQFSGIQYPSSETTGVQKFIPQNIVPKQGEIVGGFQTPYRAPAQKGAYQTAYDMVNPTKFSGTGALFGKGLASTAEAAGHLLGDVGSHGIDNYGGGHNPNLNVTQFNKGGYRKAQYGDAGKRLPIPSADQSTDPLGGGTGQPTYMGYPSGQEFMYKSPEGEDETAKLIHQGALAGPLFNAMGAAGMGIPYPVMSYINKQGQKRWNIEEDPRREKPFFPEGTESRVKTLEKIRTNKKFGGFPEVHAFPTQPTLKGISDYGYPTPQIPIAQEGGQSLNLDTNIFANDINAYTGEVTPKQMFGEDYQWPQASNYIEGSTFNQQPGGAYNIPLTSENAYGGAYNGIFQGNTELPEFNYGSDYMRCGGSRMEQGGFPLINEGPGALSEGLAKFTTGIKQNAFDVIQSEMDQQSGYHMMPDGTPMLNSEMKKGGSKDWISGAVNPAHKGYCTPMSKSTCTPSRKAFARRAKAGFKEYGGDYNYDGDLPMAKYGDNNWDYDSGYKKRQDLRSKVKGHMGEGYKSNWNDEEIYNHALRSGIIKEGTTQDNAGYDPNGVNPYGNRMMGSGFGNPYGGWAWKTKNKFYGQPGLGAYRSKGTSDADYNKQLSQNFKDQGLNFYQDIKPNALGSIFGMGPRVRTYLGSGDNPFVGGRGKRNPDGTIVGNKLRKLFGPKGEASSPMPGSPSTTGSSSYEESPIDGMSMEEFKNNFPGYGRGTETPAIAAADDAQYMEDQNAAFTQGTEINPMTGEPLPPNVYDYSQAPPQAAPPIPFTPNPKLPGFIQENVTPFSAAPTQIQDPEAFQQWRAKSQDPSRATGFRQEGGDYNEGDELELTPAEIKKLKAMGYQFDIIK